MIDEVLDSVDGRHKKLQMASEVRCGALAFRQAFQIACRVARFARLVSSYKSANLCDTSPKAKHLITCSSNAPMPPAAPSGKASEDMWLKLTLHLAVLLPYQLATIKHPKKLRQHRELQHPA